HGPRGADVIPHVRRRAPTARGRPPRKHRKSFEPPDKCTVCGSKVERPQDEVMVYCPNVSCPGRILEGIGHFASRGAMDIRGLGYERVRALLEAKLIANVADLYELQHKKLELLALEGFAEKSVDQLLAAIEDSKQR